LLTKLGRVALLIPVSIVLGILYDGGKIAINKRKFKDFPIPWFIFGFIGMSLINTSGIIAEIISEYLINLSVLLMSMAMAGLGLNIQFRDLLNIGKKTILMGVLGSLAVSFLGVILVYLFI